MKLDKQHNPYCYNDNSLLQPMMCTAFMIIMFVALKSFNSSLWIIQSAWFLSLCCILALFYFAIVLSNMEELEDGN